MMAGTRIGLMLAALLACVSSVPARAGLDELRAAAEQGDAERQLELGQLYEFGFQLPDNLVPALTWYLLSAEQGNAKAAARRDLLKTKLTAEQIAQAEHEADKLRGTRAPAPVPAAPAPESPPAEPVPVAAPTDTAPAE